MIKYRTLMSQCLVVTGLVFGLSVAAQADCVRSTRTVDAVNKAVAEPKSDNAVSLSDPALDSLMARYADLHRDAVGYAVADVVGSSMFAKANNDAPSHLTR